MASSCACRAHDCGTCRGSTSDSVGWLYELRPDYNRQETVSGDGELARGAESIMRSLPFRRESGCGIMSAAAKKHPPELIRWRDTALIWNRPGVVNTAVLTHKQRRAYKHVLIYYCKTNFFSFLLSLSVSLYPSFSLSRLVVWWACR